MLTLNSLILPRTKRHIGVPTKINYINRNCESINFQFSNEQGMKIKMTGKLYKEAFGEYALQIALEEVDLTLNENGQKANALIYYK